MYDGHIENKLYERNVNKIFVVLPKATTSIGSI